MGCVFCVPEDEVWVVEQCGKADEHDVRRAGFFAIVPCICEVVGEVSMRLKHLECQIETKTKDDVWLTITLDVQYEVSRTNGQVAPATVMAVNYRLSDVRTQLRAYIEDKVRAFVPQHKLDSIFTLKEELVNHIINGEIVQHLSSFGWDMKAVLVIKIDPTPKVKDAMNSINAQERIRVAVTDKAEAEKIQTVKNAEAEAEAKKLQGDGIARQRNAIIDGLQASTADFANSTKDINHTDVLELVLITQYFDTLKAIAGRSTSKACFFQQAKDKNTASYRQAFIEASNLTQRSIAG